MQETYNVLSNLPDHSRVWLYQSNRLLTSDEQDAIKKAASGFVAEWNAHGAQLKAGFDIVENCFLILAVDEQQAAASGCSIDKSVAFFRQVDEQLGLDLFDRFNVAFFNTNGQLELAKLNGLEKFTDQSLIDDNCLVFDNLTNELGALRSSWLKPFKSSWHQQFLPKSV